MARYGFRDEPGSLKAFILFVMSRSAEDVSLEDMIEMIMIDDNIDYFQFFEETHELTNSGHLFQRKGRFGQEVYNITPRGRVIAEFAESTLPHALKRAAEDVVKVVSERVRRDACIDTEVFYEEAEPMVCLRLTDGYAPMMRLEIVAGNEDDARKMCANFRRQAESIFEEISLTVRKSARGT